MAEGARHVTYTGKGDSMTNTNEAMNKAIRSARSDGGTREFIERLKKSILAHERKEQVRGDKDNRTSN